MIEQPVEEIHASFDLVWEKLQAWVESAIGLLPNLVVAILVVLVFGLLSRLVRKLAQRVLNRVTSNRQVARLLATILGIVVLVVGLFVALGVLQLDKTVTSLLAGAGVIGIALAFAFQDLAANFMAGIYMSFRKPFKLGDIIETNDAFGTVEIIDLRSTVLYTPQGQCVRIPNKEIFENKLVNFSTLGRRRVDLVVGVSYGEDLERVQRIAVEAVNDLEVRLPDRDVDLVYDGFGSSSIDFTIRFWIAYQRQADFRRARSAAIIAIKKAFDDNDIMIPFPIRTLDFGIKGGLPVAEAVTPLLAARTSQEDPAPAEESAQA